MIDPIKCAERITRNDPDLAEPLLDLLIWANQPDLSQNNDYDEALSRLYARLQDCRDARARYVVGRAAA